jgi:aspartate kinase
MGVIVCKFGGSSVAEAGQIRKVAAIIRSDPRRRFIVVSAPGKRRKDDEKITDLLYRCRESAAQGKSFAAAFAAIRSRYLEIERDLETDSGVEQALEEIESRLGSGVSPDWAASRGEYLSARIMSRVLGASFVDAAEIVKIDAHGSVQEASYPAVERRLRQSGLYVIPGFYGSGPGAEIRTFSRGGSDITGAIVARAVGARLYENWTDVSGLLMVDPRLVEQPRAIETVTYREIRELSRMGAGVFHEEAMAPI